MAAPTMDLSLWRRRARVVAYIDLVMCILALAFTVYILILGVGTTAVIVKHGDEIKEQMEMDNVPTKYLDVFMWITWFTIALQAITVSIEMWAAIMLLKATEMVENDLKLALRRAGIWRIVCTSFLILKVFLCFYGVNSFLCLALDILFRGTLLFVVCNFMSALEQAIQTPSKLSPPTSVVVKS